MLSYGTEASQLEQRRPVYLEKVHSFNVRLPRYPEMDFSECNEVVVFYRLLQNIVMN